MPSCEWTGATVTERRSSGIFSRTAAALVCGLVLAGCPGGSETVDVEDYDADHGLRAIKHERGLDFSWVNTRMQHVVSIRIPLRVADGAATHEICSGVLVGENLLLTAAHCIERTHYIMDPDDCVIDFTLGTRTGDVTLDNQVIQDSRVVSVIPPGTVGGGVSRPRRSIRIRGLAAVTDDSFISEDTPDGPVCHVRDDRRELDAVVLELEEPVLGRGHARIRARQPVHGELLSVIHQPGGGFKRFSVVRGHAAPSGSEGNPIFATTYPFASGLTDLPYGSSGSPLFDEDGYVVGIYSGGCSFSSVPGCQMFANAASFASHPSFGVLTVAPEISGSGIGGFGTLPFGAPSFTRTSLGSRRMGDRSARPAQWSCRVQLGPPQRAGVRADPATVELGRGELDVVALDSEPSEVAAAFEARIGRPYLTDLSVSFDGIDVSDVYPRRLPDVYQDRPVVVHGRFAAGGDGRITVRGRIAGRPFEQVLEVTLPMTGPERPELESVWARTRIDDLMTAMALSPNDSLRREVTRIGVRHGVVTPYTTFVAVDPGDPRPVVTDRASGDAAPSTTRPERDASAQVGTCFQHSRDEDGEIDQEALAACLEAQPTAAAAPTEAQN